MKIVLARIFALALTLALTLGQAQTARADDFAGRAVAGRAAAGTVQGSGFAQSIMPLLQMVGAICDPPGTILPATELGGMDLVGDITPGGILTNVEVQPQTPLTACFAANLLKHRFDPPPRSGNYPLYIHLTVKN